MWLSLICLALIIGITFFQSIHGLLSALIFFVITLLSTALAFGLYEYVAVEFLAGWKPEFALAIALAGCFGIPLIIGRFALDTLIRRSNLIPMALDKIGAVFFGLWTAFIIVGVMVTAIQMIPFGDRGILGFQRFTEESDGEESGIWLNPDRFAVRMATMLSDGVFSGNQSFVEQHPDLITEIGWSQIIPAESRVFAKPGPITINDVDPDSPGGPLKITDYVYDKTSIQRQLDYQPVDPQAGREFWVVNFTPPSDDSAKDGKLRFTMPQIRLVGTNKHGDSVEYYPVAIRDEHEEDKHVRNQEQGTTTDVYQFMSWLPGTDGSIEVVFEIRKGFRPRFLTFKTSAHADVRAPNESDVHHPGSGDDDGDDDASAESTPSTPTSTSRRNASTGTGRRSQPSNDRVSGARAKAGKSFIGDELPVTLTDYRGREIEGNGELLESGHVIAILADQGEKDTKRHISAFKVPEGKALVQLSVKALRARSTLGGALSFAVRTIRNYLITDDNGEKHQMVGQYAIAQVGGEDVFEIQYFPEQIGSIGSGIRKFDKIKQRHLEKRNTTIVYLFLVDKGRTVVSFSTGRQQTDLTRENLVAE